MKKVILCVLDGFGYSKKITGNAVYNANTPNIDKLFKMYPSKYIEASGESVGLIDDISGNSEVGHLSLGAGRIVKQPLTIIDDFIKEDIYSNDKLNNAILYAKKNKTKLHILGLLSDGKVHSDIKHFKVILDICKHYNFNNVFFHVFTDGRDTYNKSALKYLDDLQNKIDSIGFGQIASISGRFYAMDRDNRWDRINKAYEAIVNGNGLIFPDYKTLINYNYDLGNTDEFIEPGIINKKGTIENKDSICWMNFRPDRSIELLNAITNNKFKEFKRKKLKKLNLTTMFWVPGINSEVAFNFEPITNTLGEVLKDYKQLRIAETEKYAHVTYFFDGLRNIDYEKEKKIIIASDKVKTYDLKPEMKTKEITETLIKELKNDYNFILVNYASADMVGHTGNYEKTIDAIEYIDKNIKDLYNKAVENDYILLITADHGNAEEMIDNNKNVITRHTTNKVPIIVCDEKVNININSISEVSKLILDIMNIKIPDEMK